MIFQRGKGLQLDISEMRVMLARQHIGGLCREVWLFEEVRPLTGFLGRKSALRFQERKKSILQ